MEMESTPLSFRRGSDRRGRPDEATGGGGQFCRGGTNFSKLKESKEKVCNLSVLNGFSSEAAAAQQSRLSQ